MGLHALPMAGDGTAFRIPLSYLATNSGPAVPFLAYIPEKSPHRPEGSMHVFRVVVWVRAGWLLLQEGGWLTGGSATRRSRPDVHMAAGWILNTVTVRKARSSIKL